MNKRKKIWIVNYYTSPPGCVSQPRYLNLVPYLEKSDFDVTIINSGNLKGGEIDLIGSKGKYLEKEYDGYKFFHIKTLNYSGNGIKRMLSIFMFSVRLFFLRNKIDKPDIIYHNIHAPFDLPVYFVAKKLNAKYVVEAWDLWPHSFHTLGLINKNNPLMKLAYKAERFLYRKGEKIVFTFEGGRDYIIEMGWDKKNGGPIDLEKIVYLNNGVELSDFTKNKEEYITYDGDLDNDDYFKILYIGSIRHANNVKLLLDAALILKDDTKIKFLIYGDGTDREMLKKFAKDNNLANVVFKDKYLPFNQLPNILSKSDLNIMNYRKNFGEYGVSSGKLALYLASGKPVISNVSVRYCIIKKYNIGVSRDIDTAEEYANAILSIKNMNEKDYNDMCGRVKDAAKTLDYKVLSETLVSSLNEVANYD